MGDLVGAREVGDAVGSLLGARVGAPDTAVGASVGSVVGLGVAAHLIESSGSVMKPSRQQHFAPKLPSAFSSTQHIVVSVSHP